MFFGSLVADWATTKKIEKIIQSYHDYLDDSFEMVKQTSPVSAEAPEGPATLEARPSSFHFHFFCALRLVPQKVRFETIFKLLREGLPECHT